MSDTVAFLLLFAILLGVSIAGTAGGIDALQRSGAADAGHVDTRSLGALRADLTDIAAGAPRRTTVIRTTGGRLTVGEPITVTFTVRHATGAVGRTTIRSTPIAIETADGSTRYTIGAIRRDRSGFSRLAVGPSWRIDPDQTLLTLVNTSPAPGSATIGGTTTARVVSRRAGVTVHRFDPEPGRSADARLAVRVTIETPGASAWARYLARLPVVRSVTVAPAEDRVHAVFDTESLVVRTVHVTVHIGR